MHRDRYIEVLRLIADSEAQTEYEKNVPIANVPAELICMWFDDLAAQKLDDRLSPDDRKAIESFSAFFEARLDQLADSEGIRSLQSSPAWVEITREARSTLTRLDQ